MAATGELLSLGDGSAFAAPEPATGDDPVSQLRAMFPAFDSAVIETIYNDVTGCDLEKTIETLLQMADDSVDAGAGVDSEQSKADERLALEMLQQMMNEEDMARTDADRTISRIQADAERKDAFKNSTKGVKDAFARQLEKMKQRALGRKAAGADGQRDYQQQYGALLDDDHDESMKV
jgi:hypothetical protein